MPGFQPFSASICLLSSRLTAWVELYQPFGLHSKSNFDVIPFFLPNGNWVEFHRDLFHFET